MKVINFCITRSCIKVWLMLECDYKGNIFQIWHWNDKWKKNCYCCKTKNLPYKSKPLSFTYTFIEMYSDIHGKQLVKTTSWLSMLYYLHSHIHLISHQILCISNSVAIKTDNKRALNYECHMKCFIQFIALSTSRSFFKFHTDSDPSWSRR